jgi:tripartite-type tricarboxylate transporter receptor subunit TctC
VEYIYSTIRGKWNREESKSKLGVGFFGGSFWDSKTENRGGYPHRETVQRDFAPIVLISLNPLLIVGSKKVRASNLKDLIASLKASLGKAAQGTSGFGSVGHIGGLFFQKMTGTKYTFTPYRELALAMLDLVAGTIDMMFDTPATSLP